MANIYKRSKDIKEVRIINTFWTNSIWYIILAEATVGLLSFVLLKSKQKNRDLGFFFAIVGLVFIIETVVYIFFNAYEYYPKIIPHSPKNDGVVGNLISQFSISTAALFICVFNISFKKVVCIGAIFYLIERLFLYLGIYQHYWYKAWITFIGLVILFEFVKRWYKSVMWSTYFKKHYFADTLGILALYLPTTNWIGILSGYVDIIDNILIDPFISHVIVAIPKYLLQINTIYFLHRRRSHWKWWSIWVAVFLMWDIILYLTKLMYVKEGWLLIYSSLSILSTYLYVYIMDGLLYGHKNKSKQ